MAAAANSLLLALLVCGLAALPPLACGSRYRQRTGFVVEGGVFCDTCQAGFETPATTFIAGAKVRVECRDRETSGVKYTAEGVTDGAGRYRIPVEGEHQDEICETVALSSPERGCTAPLSGRERARVVLAHNNGVASDNRVANNLGFRRDAAIAGCAEVMRVYQQYDD
uniref:Olee1-like protein n=1 Tax=Anthurium amnicola TaxID=1678845 RepID=A0A1D1XI62_9ARAE